MPGRLSLGTKAFLFLNFVMNLTVKRLKGFDLSISVGFDIMNTAGSGSGSGNGGHVGHLCLDGCLAQIAVIVDAVLAGGRIDDQLDISIGDHI